VENTNEIGICHLSLEISLIIVVIVLRVPKDKMVLIFWISEVGVEE